MQSLTTDLEGIIRELSISEGESPLPFLRSRGKFYSSH